MRSERFVVLVRTAVVIGMSLAGMLGAAGGQAQMLSPSESGIHGNSHMIMQDKNNLQIADLILKWIDERVSTPKSALVPRANER